jgi:hypothetical protein
MHASIHPSIHIHPFMHPSIRSSMRASIHPCIHSFIHPSIHPCMHPSTHSSIYTNKEFVAMHWVYQLIANTQACGHIQVRAGIPGGSVACLQTTTARGTELGKEAPTHQLTNSPTHQLTNSPTTHQQLTNNSPTTHQQLTNSPHRTYRFSPLLTALKHINSPHQTPTHSPHQIPTHGRYSSTKSLRRTHSALLVSSVICTGRRRLPCTAGSTRC